jgi:hypothetical protein
LSNAIARFLSGDILALTGAGETLAVVLVARTTIA